MENIMKLNEYMNTEEYKEASIIQYIDADGEEIETEESELLNMEVINVNKLSGGYFEIELDEIVTREVVLRCIQKYSAKEINRLCSAQESADFLLQRLRYNLNDEVKTEIISAIDNK